mmetsp:Transcript_122254/g.228315  ORF Transcript_122254/g.228315 Transcript_122254/m.228315 type:complete len:1511 (-) Transcript_122254:145-4677(-)
MLSSGHALEAPDRIPAELTDTSLSCTVQDEEGDVDSSPDDLLELADFSYAALLNALRLRHQRQEPYTWIGPVLVSINPCMHLERPDLFPSTPHPFSLVGRALEGGGPAAIIVTGESGAGKTEAVKAMLSFLVEQRGARSDRVRDVLVGSNEALEAFGNAQTLQNNNSSRFGKLTEVLLDSATGHAESAAVVPYMLEASRVTHHGRGELNYHVFYVLGEALESTARRLSAGHHPSSMADPSGNTGGELWSWRDDLWSTWCSLARCAVNSGLSRSQYLAPSSAPSGPKSPSWRSPRRSFGGESAAATDLPAKQAVWKEACVSAGRFEDIVGSMRAVGLSDDETLAAMQVVLAVALLGNVSIAAVLPEGADASPASSPGRPSPRLESSSADAAAELAATALQSVADLLAVPLTELQSFLGTRTTDVPRGGGKFIQPRSPREVLTLRDSVAREVYTALFQWLVRRVAARQESNSVPAWSPSSYKESRGQQRVAILDIYGFEVCQTNGLEQMLINYCNERLQSLFNMQLFAAEAREYEIEGLPPDVWVPLCKTRPLPALLLFEGDDGERRSTGIFALIDDEARCRFNDGSDTALRSKMDASLGGHTSYKACRSASCFTVAHFAGEVVYDSRSFVETNANAARPEIISFLMSASSSSFLNSVLRTRLDGPPEASGSTSLSPPSSGRRRQLFGRTVIQAFRTELEQLIASFERPGTRCHYLRCLKPNAALRPLEFDDAGVLRQCRYSGLLETVKIRHYGYAHRRPILEFVERYALVAWPAWASGRATANVRSFRDMPIGDLKAWAAGILVRALKGRFGKLEASLTEDDALMGRKKVFMRPRAFRHFEAMIVFGHSVVVPIQAAWRGYNARFTYQLARQLIISLQAVVRGVFARSYVRQILSAMRIQACFRGFCVRRLVKQVLARHVVAAVTIQRVYRGCRTRRRLLRARHRKAVDYKTACSGSVSARAAQSCAVFYSWSHFSADAKENCPPPEPFSCNRRCSPKASPQKRTVMGENLTAAQLLRAAQQHKAHLDAVHGKLESLKGERVRLLRDLAGARTSTPPLVEVRVLAPMTQAANVPAQAAAYPGAQCSPNTTPPTPSSMRPRPTSPLQRRPAPSPLQIRTAGANKQLGVRRQRSTAAVANGNSPTGSPALRTACRSAADMTALVTAPGTARVPPAPAWATATDPWATFAVNRTAGSSSSTSTGTSRTTIGTGSSQGSSFAGSSVAPAPSDGLSSGPSVGGRSVRSPRQHQRSISRGSSFSPDQSERSARRKGDLLQELFSRCGKISQMERDILLAEEAAEETGRHRFSTSTQSDLAVQIRAPKTRSCSAETGRQQRRVPKARSCSAENARPTRAAPRQPLCQASGEAARRSLRAERAQPRRHVQPRETPCQAAPIITPRDGTRLQGGQHLSQAAAPFTPPPKQPHGKREVDPVAAPGGLAERAQQMVMAPRDDALPATACQAAPRARRSPVPVTVGAPRQEATAQHHERRSLNLAKARKLAHSASETLRRLHA